MRHGPEAVVVGLLADSDVPNDIAEGLAAELSEVLSQRLSEGGLVGQVEIIQGHEQGIAGSQLLQLRAHLVQAPPLRLSGAGRRRIAAGVEQR